MFVNLLWKNVSWQLKAFQRDLSCSGKFFDKIPHEKAKFRREIDKSLKLFGFLGTW